MEKLTYVIRVEISIPADEPSSISEIMGLIEEYGGSVEVENVTFSREEPRAHRARQGWR